MKKMKKDEKKITFRDLYVPLQVKLLDIKGEPIPDTELVDIEEWVRARLDDSPKEKKVLFIQGEAGRGKSVFCRIFADKVRQALHPTFTPIVVRLRHLRSHSQFQPSPECAIALLNVLEALSLCNMGCKLARL